MLIQWFGDGVHVSLDDAAPIELTAPIDVSAGPPERPFLDVLRRC